MTTGEGGDADVTKKASPLSEQLHRGREALSINVARGCAGAAYPSSPIVFNYMYMQPASRHGQLRVHNELVGLTQQHFPDHVTVPHLQLRLQVLPPFLRQRSLPSAWPIFPQPQFSEASGTKRLEMELLGDADDDMRAFEATLSFVEEYASDALALAASPPPASEEFAHEEAAAFVFTDEMRTVRQLQSKCEEGRALVNAIYCCRSCARAFPPGVVADEADPSKMRQYHHAIFTETNIYWWWWWCSAAAAGGEDQAAERVLRPGGGAAERQHPAHDGAREHDARDPGRHDGRARGHHGRDSAAKPLARHQKQFEKRLHCFQEVRRGEDAYGALRAVGHITVCLCICRVFLHVKDDLPDAESVEKDIARLQEFMGSSYQAKGAVWDSLRHNLTNVKRFKYIRALSYLMAVLEGSVVWKKTNSLPGADKKVIEAVRKASSRLFNDDVFVLAASLWSTYVDVVLYYQAGKLIARFPVIPVLLETSVKPAKVLQSQGSYRLESTNGVASCKNRDAIFDIVAASRDCKATCEAFLPRLMHMLNSVTDQEHDQGPNDTAYEVLVDGIAHICKWKSDGANNLWREISSPDLEGVPVEAREMSSDFKKKHKERKFSQIPDRTASASLCQIQMLRTAIDSMYAKRSMGDLNAKSSTPSAIFSFKKDLDSSDAESLQEFYHKAGAFPVLLNLSTTLDELADFSCLWFREQYLELAKSVQIPAEISLPWLLIEHSLDGASTRVEPVLAILDAYNDAGSCSLHELRQQHLYDEAEAEGKLCFDHFVFLLAERVYLHYKSLAAKDVCQQWSCHGTAPDRNLPVKSAVVAKLNPTLVSLNQALGVEEEDAKYESILTQRHVNVFGRNYDLTFQLGQRVDALVRKDLEGWFTKFEASDATCYVAMLEILKVLKRTHSSLSTLGLDEFDDVFEETNDESVECLLNPLSVENPIQSRVHEQISQTIRTDLCQHFSLKFNYRRFIRMPLHEALVLKVGDQFAHEECLRKAKKHRLSRGSILRTKLGNSAAVKAAKYGALEKTITGTHRAYFGEPHIQALCELLPKRELLAVANDCIDFAVTKIEDVLALCIPALGSTIPPFRLPRFMYRTEDSNELEAQIFHCFREIGNALMFLLVLGTIFNVNAIQSNATQQPVTSTERLPSLFQCALERIDSMLKRSEIALEWEAGPDSQPEKMPNASSFYHVWCALEFLSCNRPRGGGDDSMEQGELLSVREMFGDGVQLAGCTLVHLLGQRTLYDLWNVSQHVLNVRHYEEVKTASETQVALVSSSTKSRQKGEAPNLQTTVGTLDRDMEDKAARFVVNAREMRATSKQMFHTLELAWPSGPRSPATFAPPPFTPPLKTPSSPLGAQYHR
ncbi:hypothetical protein ON010_g4213 [Phytophthora cinnamomi]|nr:hypothetical protein ON010_g4213 [Phytophthora cinnamomi]